MWWELHSVTLVFALYFNFDIKGTILKPFFKNWRKCPDFGKKSPDFFHLWVKLSIQGVVLRISWRKNSNISLRGLFSLCFQTKYLSKCPDSTKAPLPWKISDCSPVLVLWRKNETQNSFESLASKKTGTWRLKRTSGKRSSFIKNNTFQLLHRMKNISRSKLCQ